MRWFLKSNRWSISIPSFLVTFLGFAVSAESANLRLAWTDNSNNEDGFKIERMVAGGTLAQIATVGANSTSYTDSDLESGRSYCYTVRAFNSSGTSAPTNLACATTDSGRGGGRSSGGTAGTATFNNTVLTVSNDSDSGSTRASVRTGDQVMIGGFVIEGSEPTIVLIRGRGPSMGGAPFFVPGTLSNPRLQLFSGSSVIAQNDNWQDSPQCDPSFPCGTAAQIQATSMDPCDPNPGQSSAPSGCAYESAILTILSPGAYTAVLSGVGGSSGVGLVEVFEIDANSNATKLANISTRAAIQSSDDVMIGGVILAGPTSKTVLIRGRGPSMSGAPFYLPGTLSNPQLQLYSGSTLIAQNDNWQDKPQCDPQVACATPSQILATGLEPCEPNPGETSPPPGCAQEAALLVTLPPGAYTAMLRGVGGATGVALVEIFDLN